jgi:ABC-type Na+ efflux pump permease subunit
LVVSIGLPVLISLIIRNSQISVLEIGVLLNASTFLFIIPAALTPTILASYSFLGEKLEKSLEPLLATPTTDGELLLGKGLAALLPSVVVTYVGATIFVVLVDALTLPVFGHAYLPDSTTAVVLLLAVPLACVFSVESNVIIASLVGDVRAAQQLGTIASLPFGGVYVLAETNFTSLNYANLMIVSATLFAIVLILLQTSRTTFRREEILTKWK